MGAHGYFLQLQGEDPETVQALARGDIDATQLDDAHRALMHYVAKLTRHSYKATREDVEHLEASGWSNDQVAEAVYVAALFALFNRVADAFGLEDPGYDQMSAAGKKVLPADKYK